MRLTVNQVSVFDEHVLTPFFNTIENKGSSNSFCINEIFYSYQEFARTVSKIRDALQQHRNISSNIGLIVNDDIETYAAIFAIWLEGYSYVPLHPHQPVERSLDIISQADIDLIIDSAGKILSLNIPLINSSQLLFEKINLTPVSTPDSSLAYILFTSGSTGVPKGVPITRGNIGSFMKSFWEAGFVIDHNDRCLQCFDLTFDVSVQSFLVPLTKGACTYTIPHDQIKYSYIYGLFEDHKLTFGAMAPSMVRFLRPYFDEILVPDMRYNILTAEASPVDLVNEWKNCIPNAEIYDFYGPTEATIYCTYYKFTRDSSNKMFNGILSIGKPMNGIKAIIINENMNVVATGTKGELCVAGNQITKGYWENPKKNEESFFEMIIEGTTHRFYRTGDSCFYDEDGYILYAGRLDYQVKVQGYRVELGEIEFHGRAFFRGQNTIAVPFLNKNGNTEIALFIEGNFPDKTGLLKYLRSKMPDYMVPSQLFNEAVFPLNQNGKIDRNKLKTLIPG